MVCLRLCIYAECIHTIVGRNGKTYIWYIDFAITAYYQLGLGCGALGCHNKLIVTRCRSSQYADGNVCGVVRGAMSLIVTSTASTPPSVLASRSDAD